MDITNSILSAASPVQSAAPEPDEIAPTLSINLSRTEELDRKLALVQERRDRNYRRDLLRDTLIAKSAMRDLQSIMRKGQKQVDNSSDPVAVSNSNLGLNTSGGGDLDVPIDQVSSLSGIASGNIVVMGETISVDITSDSVNDVIDRINNSNAGLTASFNTTSNKFEITDDQDFSISNGTSNFFAGLNVTTGTIESEEEDSQVSFFKSSKFIEAFDRFNRKMNQLFETAADVSYKLGIANEEDDDGEVLPDNPFTTSIKGAVENAITSQYDDQFDGTGKSRFDFGFDISFTNGDFLSLDSKDLEENMDGNVPAMLKFFLTEEDETNYKSGGLFALVEKSLNTIISDMQEEINKSDQTGLLVDVEA